MKKILIIFAFLLPALGRADNTYLNCGSNLEGPYKQKLVISSQGVFYGGRVYSGYEQQASASGDKFINVIFLASAEGTTIAFCPEQ